MKMGKAKIVGTRLRRMLALVLTLCLTAGLFGGLPPVTAEAAGAAPNGTTVTIAQIFPDPVFADWVAEALSKDTDYTPTTVELAGITKEFLIDSFSNANHGNFTDWAGVQYLTGLTKISISAASASGELSDLSTLTNLSYLSLYHTKISGELSNLSASTNLSNLYLEGTEVSGGLSSLSTLTNLSYLYLDDTKISGELSDLSALTNLSSLSLGRTEVSGELSAINTLTNLSHLNLNDTKINGVLSSLNILTNLSLLSLERTEVSGGLSDLGALTNLSYLYLDDTKISGVLSIPSALTNLSHLNLSHTKIGGVLSSLSALTNLSVLRLESTEVSGELSGLNALTNLSTLSLDDTKISGELSDLSALTNLSTLSLSQTNVKGDLSSFSTLTNLFMLLLDDTEISGDISSLVTLTKLGHLHLSGLKINLPSIEFTGSPIAVAVPVKDSNGDIIIPNSFAGGTYDDGSVTWAFPHDTEGTLSYTFSKSVSIGKATGTYSGTVYQPYTNTNPDVAISIPAIGGVTAPVAGASPTATITETAQYTGTVTWSPALTDSKFDYNTAYTATITIAPKAGYTLTGVAADYFTVAGAASATNSANSAEITAVFPATGQKPDAVISIPAIAGVAVPVVGASPTATIAETAQYTGAVSWSPALTDSKFDYSTAYTATITLAPKAGYTLTGIVADYFTVAGASATNSAESGEITAVFPATGQKPDAVISIPAIGGVTAPVAGMSPVTAIAETAQYTGTVSWSPALTDSKFDYNTAYTATITLAPKAGYTLTGVVADYFTVAGASATNSANNGVITAVFPATGQKPDAAISIPAIGGVTAPVAGASPTATITETTQYTGTVTWSPALTDSKFDYSTAYTATITLAPKAGYTLTGVAADYFTVAGAASATNSANSAEITAVFPATGQKPDAAISIAAIAGVTAPVAGASPVAAIAETAQYTGTVAWSPQLSDGKFDYSTAYTATITLAPKPGYTLTGIAANYFTVAGASATNSANSGAIKAVFPATRSPAMEYGTDTFNFINTETHFSSVVPHNNKLTGDYYSYLLQGETPDLKDFIDYQLTQTWAGYCFGMAAVAAQVKAGLLHPDYFVESESSTYGLPMPKDNPTVYDLVSFYMWSQLLPEIDAKRASTGNWQTDYTQFINKLRSTKYPAVFSLGLYSKDGATSKGGHAVVAYDLQETEQAYVIQIYDPNYKNENQHNVLTISKNYLTSNNWQTVTIWSRWYDPNVPKNNSNSSAYSARPRAAITMEDGVLDTKNIETHLKSNGQTSVDHRSPEVNDMPSTLYIKNADFTITDGTTTVTVTNGALSSESSFIRYGTPIDGVVADGDGAAVTLAYALDTGKDYTIATGGENSDIVLFDHKDEIGFFSRIEADAGGVIEIKRDGSIGADFTGAGDSVSITTQQAFNSIPDSAYSFTVENKGAGSALSVSKNSGGTGIEITSDSGTVDVTVGGSEYRPVAFSNVATDSGRAVTVISQAKQERSEVTLIKLDGTEETKIAENKTSEPNDPTPPIPGPSGGGGGGSPADTKTGDEETDSPDPTPTPTEAPAVSDWVNPFGDVSESDWFYGAVKAVVASGLMNGTGNGFDPNSNATRAQIITIIARAAGVDTDGGETWYSKAVEWAAAQGITDGTDLDSPITREQIVTMLWRYAGEPTADSGAAFADGGAISEWALEAVAWATAQGIVNGYTDSTFKPQNNANRAEIAAIIKRWLEL
jgi:Leucine-rich repeat (LRR) protein